MANQHLDSIQTQPISDTSFTAKNLRIWISSYNKMLLAYQEWSKSLDEFISLASELTKKLIFMLYYV